MKDFKKFSLLKERETIATDSTPFISDGKIHYNRTVQQRNDEVNAIELDENETRYALWRGKLDKWYKARNREYWAEKESKKPSGSSW